MIKRLLQVVNDFKNKEYQPARLHRNPRPQHYHQLTLGHNEEDLIFQTLQNQMYNIHQHCNFYFQSGLYKTKKQIHITNSMFTWIKLLSF